MRDDFIGKILSIPKKTTMKFLLLLSSQSGVPWQLYCVSFGEGKKEHRRHLDGGNPIYQKQHCHDANFFPVPTFIAFGGEFPLTTLHIFHFFHRFMHYYGHVNCFAA